MIITYIMKDKKNHHDIIILVATYIKEALAGELFAADGTKHLVRLSANLHFEIIRLVLVGH